MEVLIPPLPSISGRSLLLQAILYGSLRYWLFSMRMPESLHVALDKDSYNLLSGPNSPSPPLIRSAPLRRASMSSGCRTGAR